MTPDHWLSVLARLSPVEPLDLDNDAAPKARFGQGLPAWSPAALPPSPRLWERQETGASYLGIRVDLPLDDPARAALRLAAAALERGVTPVILTSLDQSGFEPFGFRIERFVGGTGVDRAAWEAEMSAFWQFALIIDAGDVVALG